MLLSLGHAVCWLCRGVFQSLVEKHFPAPDRRKMLDLLTVSSSSSHRFDESPVPSPSAGASVKRKLDSSGKLFCIETRSVFIIRRRRMLCFYFSLSVCLSVRRITEKVMNGFGRNFLEG